MKRLISITILLVLLTVGGLALFGGRAMPESLNVEPLPVGVRPPARTVQTGLVESLAMAPGFEAFDLARHPDRSYHPNLELMKVLVSYGPDEDPRIVFLLVSFYLSANQQADGIAFFETFLKRYEHQLSGTVKAHYLTADAILRATYAERVPLLKRIGWVNETTRILEEADRLTDGEDFLVHWATGQIYTQYPRFFGKTNAAFAHLQWTLEHPDQEPAVGFYREVYRHLSILYGRTGNAEEAARYLERSGYRDTKSKSLLMGPFMTTRQEGTIMHARREVVEIVPGSVYVVRGFGFSEIYFVISADGQELIAVDAGTQPYSLKAAYELFTSAHPDHPPLTSVLVTHAHWDHIGGHTFFRELNPEVTFYGRRNMHRVLSDVQRQHSFVQFRGERFVNEWVADYAPDIVVEGDKITTLTIGGSPIELIPIHGGETEDAMLVFFPALSVMMVGDFMMPYYGEPWVEEGSVDALLPAMTAVAERYPRHVLHGHFPLTFIYPAEVIDQLRDDVAWLTQSVRTHIHHGYARGDIERLNLIPAGLQEKPATFIGYANARQHLPARLHDQAVGIWDEDRTGTDLTGLDLLSHAEYGRLFGRYLKLSPREVAAALRRMIDAGDNELALNMALAALRYYGDEPRLQALMVEAADQLRSENQFLNPFKYTVYSEIAGREEAHLPPLE
ncbi:MAG: MBL fold metallo-hydrolase [Chloroflexi bacterium]|nr:MBL fold metallo-hydrolase [Chloroflexota bacterium]